MTEWSLQQILASLHDDIQQRLENARRAFAQPRSKGDVSESVWVELLSEYLPKRYRVAASHVVDSKGTFSDQIDVVVFDRQYSPFIFHYAGQKIVPAESVYAVFEVKQTVDADLIRYAQEKVMSVRQLHRTSQPIPYAGGEYPPKPLPPILGGILALESQWKPPLGRPLRNALNCPDSERRLDLGCVAAHGVFVLEDEGIYAVTPQQKPATAFLFELIARLQVSATVPMIDIRAYAQWLL